MNAPRDPGLQPERTELAWRRTVLALGAGSLISIRVLLPALGDRALPAGAGGVLLAGLLWALARRRHRAVREVFAGRAPASAMPGGALLLALAGFVTAGALVGLASVLVLRR